MGKRTDLLAELEAAGVTENRKGPVAKQPLAVLEGMVAKVREDQRWRSLGAGPCPVHAGQVFGACPFCRGLWVEEEDDAEEGE